MLNSELFQKPAGSSSFYDYQIDHSARFDRADGSRLTGYANNFGTGNRQKWTFSFWFKLTASAGFGSNQYYIFTSATNSVGSYDTMIFDVDSSSRFYYQTVNKYLYPEGSFRDTTTWGHLVFVYDSANSTATDRKIVYLNGTRLGDYDDQGLTQSAESQFNWGTKTHYIGARQDLNASYFYDGYLAEVNFADGQAYAPTQFGETKNGVWIPKDPSGTNYGTTGFHLKFENASDLGNDSSGNNNDFSVTNGGTDHQVLDSPTFGS